MKIYKSKEGLQFRISTISMPSDGHIVYFTQAEFDWIKSQNLGPNEFRFLWLSKKEDHLYQIIPEVDLNAAAQLANKYVPGILKEIKNKAGQKSK